MARVSVRLAAFSTPHRDTLFTHACILSSKLLMSRQYQGGAASDADDLVLPSPVDSSSLVLVLHQGKNLLYFYRSPSSEEHALLFYAREFLPLWSTAEVAQETGRL